MKIIDLLNIWVENKNKLPKKIKVDDEIFVYDEQTNLYKIPRKKYFLISNYLDCIERINTNVEVIEENKEIEELEISDSDRKVMATFTLNNREKINEIIRAVNKLNIDLNEITNIHKEVNKRITDK